MRNLIPFLFPPSAQVPPPLPVEYPAGPVVTTAEGNYNQKGRVDKACALPHHLALERESMKNQLRELGMQEYRPTLENILRLMKRNCIKVLVGFLRETGLYGRI